MTENNRIKVWLSQIRAPFLILAMVLVLIGIAAALYEGHFHWGHSILLIIGVILAHVSVNLFNELSDHHTGIDGNTIRTPFSGGSGMMQSGKTSAAAVSIVAYSTLMAAAAIGIYFCFIRSWWILVFMIFGGIGIRFYTSRLAKWMIGELFSGLTLGTFVVLGTFYALTGKIGVEIILVSIPPGILTALLLFLNEFPDAEADKTGGRRHLVIYFGKKISSRIYMAGLLMVYVTIIAYLFIDKIPDTLLISLLTLPIAIKASITVVKNYDHHKRLVPALGMNILVVILTDLLLAVGFFIA
ncbi:MAG: prenyltransferase [Candidatus Aminicenantes bacterium]|nr:prenyltransferase [Candidatus Aminicenantes bacterium]